MTKKKFFTLTPATLEVLNGLDPDTPNARMLRKGIEQIVLKMKGKRDFLICQADGMKDLLMFIDGSAFMAGALTAYINTVLHLIETRGDKMDGETRELLKEDVTKAMHEMGCVTERTNGTTTIKSTNMGKAVKALAHLKHIERDVKSYVQASKKKIDAILDREIDSQWNDAND